MNNSNIHSDTIATMKAEVLEVLENNILRFWTERMVDNENGGFYGRIDSDNVLHPEADKGAILNARILWTFSAAYRVLSQLVNSSARPNGTLDPSRTCQLVNLQTYLDMATRAKRYLLDHFIDPDYGGVYWSVDYKGRPKDTKKQFYAIGFAIYGLSEYARATGDDEALEQAIALYHSIEEHGLDTEHGGYIEATTRTWQPIADMRLSEHDENLPKSQNTHLHIIEPYTNLYRVWPSEELKESLRNLITIFSQRIINPQTHHLDLFFDLDWKRCSTTESYGHDIECSWLLHETALVLCDKDLLKEVEPIVRALATASEEGLRSAPPPAPPLLGRGETAPPPTPPLLGRGEGGIFLCEQGVRNEQTEATSPTLLSPTLPSLTGEGPGVGPRPGSGVTPVVWWVQAEAVVGFMNLYQHFADEDALQTAVGCWQYIKDYLIDYEHGEWYWSRNEDGTLNTTQDKAGFWKCPYHNGRMCLEILERI